MDPTSGFPNIRVGDEDILKCSTVPYIISNESHLSNYLGAKHSKYVEPASSLDQHNTWILKTTMEIVQPLEKIQALAWLKHVQQENIQLQPVCLHLQYKHAPFPQHWNPYQPFHCANIMNICVRFPKLGEPKSIAFQDAFSSGISTVFDDGPWVFLQTSGRKHQEMAQSPTVPSSHLERLAWEAQYLQRIAHVGLISQK